MRSELNQAIALLRDANSKSVEAALQLIHKTVFSFGMKICGHREDAEDTAQEVLVKSLPYLAKLEDPKALSTWLYTAARNRCFQGRRSKSSRREVAIEDLMPNRAELRALMQAGVNTNPEVQAQSQEESKLLHNAVLRLPPAYRTVLVLHDLEELDTDVVAAILSLQRGTVRVRLHRARLLLRKEIGKGRRGAGRASSSAKSKKRADPECRRIFANLSEYLDGELKPESCDKMRLHIEACPTCVTFIEDLKRVIDRCRSLDVSCDPALTVHLRAALTREYLHLLEARA